MNSGRNETSVTHRVLVHALAYRGVSSPSFPCVLVVFHRLRVHRSSFPTRNLVGKPLLSFSRGLCPKRRVRISRRCRPTSKLPCLQFRRVERYNGSIRIVTQRRPRKERDAQPRRSPAFGGTSIHSSRTSFLGCFASSTFFRRRASRSKNSFTPDMSSRVVARTSAGSGRGPTSASESESESGMTS